MPRGRPKGSKNKITLIKEDISKEKDTIKQEKKSNKKDSKIILNCDLCGKELYITPNIIRLQIITGKSAWHRKCKYDKLNLCDDCAVSLNTLVDDFIISKNPSLSKFK